MITSVPRDQYIAERMERWRQYAQCQCAAHATAESRDAGETWDSFKKLDDFMETMDGKKFQRRIRRMASRLTKESGKQ